MFDLRASCYQRGMVPTTAERLGASGKYALNRPLPEYPTLRSSCLRAKEERQ